MVTKLWLCAAANLATRVNHVVKNHALLVVKMENVSMMLAYAPLAGLVQLAPIVSVQITALTSHTVSVRMAPVSVLILTPVSTVLSISKHVQTGAMGKVTAQLKVASVRNSGVVLIVVSPALTDAPAVENVYMVCANANLVSVLLTVLSLNVIMTAQTQTTEPVAMVCAGALRLGQAPIALFVNAQICATTTVSASMVPATAMAQLLMPTRPCSLTNGSLVTLATIVL
jgi:hypothetical protein